MIIIKLTGGLGNQMFQYAFVRSLSENLNSELLIDNSFFNRSKYINSCLKYGEEIINFGSKISKTINTNCILDLSKYIQPPHEKYSLDCFKLDKKILNKKLMKTIQKNNKIHYYDYSSPLKPMKLTDLQDIKLPAHFTGLWQSEEFFSENQDVIRKDFEFKNSLDKMNKEISEDIKNNESICIHIRRGDFLKHPEIGICTLNYYKNSIKYLIKTLENPKFFIFSDNPQWVKKNIKIDYPAYYVSNNPPDKGYNDLHLMSLCKHFIIANSTFSWWGAWLSKNNEKIIMKPKPWQFSRIVEASNIKSKKCIEIPNNFSNYFYQSNKVLFKFNTEKNFKNCIKNMKNLKIIKNKNCILLKTLNNKSKLFFNDFKKINEHNNVIIKLNFESNNNGILRLLYLTKNSKIYNESKSFPILFKKYEELEIYFPLSNQISLNDLILCPSNKGNTNILIKEFEIREIDYQKGFY